MCYIHTHTHTHTYIYTYIHTYIHTHTHTYMHTHMHTLTLTHTLSHSHSHCHTHTHTHIHHAKMADEEDQQVENAFDTLVSITDKNGNLRKDLKQDILQSLSTLRKVFAKMKTQLENKNKENKKLSEEVMKVMEEMERTSDSHPARQVAPSLDHRQHTYSDEA